MNKALRRQKSKPQRDLGGDCFRSLISSSISYKIHTENVYWEMASKGDVYTKELFLLASGLGPNPGFQRWEECQERSEEPNQE